MEITVKVIYNEESERHQLVDETESLVLDTSKPGEYLEDFRKRHGAWGDESIFVIETDDTESDS